MKQLLFFFICFIFHSAFSKEWKTLQEYKNVTNKNTLASKDWLRTDRKQNTRVWQKANAFNLQNKLPQEYQTIQQRRAFYAWYYQELDKKGHEVVWPKMAHFISSKLQLIKAFPYNIFTKKSIKNYAYLGSETVFNHAFVPMKKIFFSKIIIKGKEALQWDKNILFKEQYNWIESLYKSIDANSLKTISKIVKGKGLYSLIVTKEIRFQGNISNATDRYDYAIHTLRIYCKKRYR
ncbi:Insecticidal toxin complex protein [Lacinutrix sp. C3R15]|uniref:Insecticidal toxin complex protein n=1 Tax=Flavobacteriaceae TaxID=49546 RepID=UPI001C090404|nr:MULTISPECIES: Insecticidal toxin complex protein [Flavobacteriaceae]MBU2938956.1 Insecticidal toxin complex protein [Lacinutrix sp. C3R15]MDO6622269.1 Insecticidal toxin complex protein [Oceanihabitans sp. 1_MG-2023]